MAFHMPVIYGLLVGSLAKFGRMIALGQAITWQHVLGHFLMMGAVGLAATVAVDLAGITDPNPRAFTAAVFAIAANDVILYLATRAWKRFLQDPDEKRGELRDDVQAELSAAALIEDARSLRELSEPLRKGKPK